uniref:Putative transglycosylase n=1 Tax=viral metagenome TaxID=1070528 RepID=A0A6H1ZFF2_9ZZZZ
MRLEDENMGFAVMILILFFIALALVLMQVGHCFGAGIDVEAIIQIESGGNPNAYNAKSGAIGLMQITRIALSEWNEHHPQQQLNPEDLFDRNINSLVGTWYLDRIKKHYCKVWKIPPTVENILIGYNWGVGNLKKWYRQGHIYSKLPYETRQYLKKYFYIIIL